MTNEIISSKPPTVAGPQPLLSVSEAASLFGYTEKAVLDLIENHSLPGQEYFSISELAQRWRCSRGTVYNRLRAMAIQVLDFAPRGTKGKKAVPVKAVLQIEERQTKRLA